MNRTQRVLGLLLALAVAAVCVRLGIWQLSRLHEKQALNARLRAALAAPPGNLRAADRLLASGGPDSLAFHRFRASGRFDADRHFLLMGRAHGGDPGVGVVTPLIVGDGPAVLVDRGWIPSFDAATAKPEQYPSPGLRTVIGLAEPLKAGRAAGRRVAWRRIDIDSLGVWSTPHLDADSVAARLPYPVRPYVLRALPDPAVGDSGLAAGPVPAEAAPYDETMHVSYAGQWFAFAAITLIGAIVLARRRTGVDSTRPGAS